MSIIKRGIILDLTAKRQGVKLQAADVKNPFSKGFLFLVRGWSAFKAVFADPEAWDVTSKMTEEYDLAKNKRDKIYMSFGNNGNEAQSKWMRPLKVAFPLKKVYDTIWSF